MQKFQGHLNIVRPNLFRYLTRSGVFWRIVIQIEILVARRLIYSIAIFIDFNLDLTCEGLTNMRIH